MASFSFEVFRQGQMRDCSPAQNTQQEMRWSLEGSVTWGALRRQVQQVWRGTDQDPNSAREDSGLEGDEEAWEVLPEGESRGRPSLVETGDEDGRVSADEPPRDAKGSLQAAPVTRLDQLQSPLFKLPVELRSYIYELVLYIPTTEPGLSIIHLPRAHTHCKAPSVLSLLLTCRRVLAEAEEVFYRVNRLIIPRPGADGFFSSLGTTRLDAMTACAMFVSDGPELSLRLAELHPLSNLRSLHVHVTRDIRYTQLANWTLMADQLVRELRKMERLRELVVTLPKVQELNDVEVARKQRFEQLVLRLQEAVGERK